MARKRKGRVLGVETPLGEGAARLVGARVATFLAGAPLLERAGDPALTAELHELRIVAKRLRYTLELFSAVLPPSTAGVVSELKALQDDLGALHDRDVLIQLALDEHRAVARRERVTLRELVRAPAPPEARRQTLRAWLEGPAAPRATLPGLAGLLLTAADERDAVASSLRARWRDLSSAGFPAQLAGLATPA